MELNDCNMNKPSLLPATLYNIPNKATDEISDFILINSYHEIALRAYVEMLRLKNYSSNTIRTYKNWFIYFLNYFNRRKPSTITKSQILDFMVTFRNNPKWSATSQNQLISSIKFFYEHLLKHPREFYDLPRAQKPEQLPTVFSESEILSIIKATDNLKHKTILCLAYAGGLRISEIVNLKIRDIDSKRMVILLRQAKGKKDRIVMLSEKLLIMFRAYYQEYKPSVWLFEGQDGNQYSARSISSMVQECKRKAKVYKKGGIHSIRHSFATHLLERGTDLLSIKELMGHNSLRTTLGYTHVSKKHISKIQSPLDRL
jgi:integrase/recombinase XerD